ncbi:hypothetical protein AWRIB419_452 [Oenococcus oeni AWRIB419]|nr:hypothetical protein AWRIB419_452 [Oenococcus oeni AWRIB419]EJO02012.1 hypothetical protein AWRIB418_822 [Oenococcus oeni AWRIB418]EJO05461.1 hypothetical protein AWRIB553_1459 [Oenococcus oeni AWRIB553]EKP90736.1 hypothetical protein AWRIB129_109 [Oenococcus oeni DSM 20252 = AWRIB129]KEP87075.1 hypothetical protein X279_08850 [Oenococcus oeni IOEB_0501]KZD13972.1 hypothetical protein AC229_1168 [Oenococcus oeni]
MNLPNKFIEQNLNYFIESKNSIKKIRVLFIFHFLSYQMNKLSVFLLFTIF